MRFTAVSALVGFLAVQLAAAGGGDDTDWQCAPGFPICSKSSNQCTNPQKGGITCAEESQPTSGSCTGVQGMGVLNANYGTMKCNSKRSLFPRGGSSAGSTDQKCIVQTCGTTKGSGITVNKGSGSQYSCTAHQIVVEQPTVVQITHYNENSNQTCSYHQLCNANEITTINNEFCGESDSHEVCVHPSSPSGPNVPIGVVGMNFNCQPAPSSSCSTPPASSPPATSSTPVVVPSKPVTPPLSTAPKVSTSVTPSAPSPIESGTTSSPVVSPSSPVVSPSSPVVSPSSPVVTPSSPVVSPSSPVVSPSSPSPIESGTTSSPVVSPSSPVISPSSPSPIESGTTSPVVSPSVTPSSPSPVISTEYTSLTTYTTVTSCPVTSTTVVSGSTSIIVKTVLTTSTITTCTRCAEKTSAPTPIQQGSTSPAPSPSSPVAPSPPAPTTTTPGSLQQVGTTNSVSSPPVVYTSTPLVLTTTTEIVLTTLTTCPVTKTITPPHQTPTVITTSTISTVISTSTSTITTTTVSPPPSSPIPVVPGQSPSSSPSPVVPPSQPSPPPAFKGCISAFFDLKGCGSNTDYDCYCKQDEVTTKVYECITNYEQDVAAQAQAMASYQGLCVKYIPQHPAIITKSVELIPTPVSTPAGNSPAPSPAGSSPAVVAPPAGTVTPAPASPVEAGQTTTTTALVPGSPVPTSAPSSSVPSTTFPVSVTVTVPCSVAAGLVGQISDGQLQVPATGVMAPGCTTTSLLFTTLAVPQMYFATSGSSVGLAAGTPAANEAGATASPASPAPGAAGVAGVAGVSGSGSAPASSAPTPTATTFKGAAAKSSHSGVFLSMVLAAVGLVVYA